MRLKKSKEPETKKSQQFDGITRLVCTSKSQNSLLSGGFVFIVDTSKLCFCFLSLLRFSAL